MKVISIFFCWLFLTLASLPAITQEIIFKVELSTDSVYLGNILELKYTVLNTQGSFQGPGLEGLRVVSGPNISSQYSMINGVVSQEATYSYYLEPLEEGRALIKPAILQDGDKTLSTAEIPIVVLPNADGEKFQKKKYGFSQIITFKDSVSTKQDSLMQKIKRIKTVKI